jgi:diaminopimelate decarboxylase
VSLASRIVETYFGVATGELRIGGVPISTLAEHYGTPLFVYDESVLAKKWEKLRKALPDRVEIFYSVKANPNPAIVKAFLARGCGLEIASAGELHLALLAGCRPERIVFAGPGKTDAEIRKFLEAGGGEIHVESLNEARRLKILCDRIGANATAAVRVNPSSEAQGGAMRMGGKSAPFGVDEEHMDAVVLSLLESPRVRVSGVHIFAGTQILDAGVLGAQYRKCVELARRVAKQLREPLATVDFGGGLGIPYFEGDSELDMEAYGKEARGLLESLEDRIFSRTRLLVEPGRYLVGEAGIYVAGVVDVKSSRGKTYAVLDGGMNHHLAASGNLGQVIKRNFPVAVLNRLDAPSGDTVDIVGPLCTPLDLLARSVELPPIEVGDLVGVFQSGAYARSASPLGFLSHPAPPEVLVTDGKHLLIRRRGTYQDQLPDASESVPG